MNPAAALIVEASLRAGALAACISAILAAFRIRSGAVRHAAWLAVLLAMPLMYFLPGVTPPLALPVPGPVLAAGPAPSGPIAPLSGPIHSAYMAAPRALSLETGAQPAPPRPSRQFPWPAALLAVYAIGAILLLARAAAGWLAARRLRHSAEPAVGQAIAVRGLPSGEAASALYQGMASAIPKSLPKRRGLSPWSLSRAGSNPAVLQSPLVATPVTIGAFSPSIVLPLAWRDWSEPKLRAVLAHEAAHARRHDVLTASIAHLNRCLFWFHPLAWWLERRLALSAEHACDEAAVRVTGQCRDYARILVDLADAVRRSGSRLAWQGVGLDGAGPLARRIERVLRGDAQRPTSRSRKALVAAACAAAIFLAAACRPSRQTLVARAEARDKERKEQMARAAAARKWETDLRASVKDLTPEQAAAMEASLAKNPDDYDARRKLIAYYLYFARQKEGASAAELQSTDAAVRSRAMARSSSAWVSIQTAMRRHTLWMIAHHPEDPLVSIPYLFSFNPPGSAAAPVDLSEARRLWLSQAERDGQPAAVYLHAAAFFSAIDLPLAEKYYLRAQALDPKGDCFAVSGAPAIASQTWHYVLGGFYAQAFQVYNARSVYAASVAPEQDKVAYLAQIARKLSQSNDVPLLLDAATPLVSMHRPHDMYNLPGIDAFAVGKAAVERAIQLDPKSTWARQIQNKVRDQELIASLPEQVWSGTFDSRHQAIEKLPEGDRFRELAILALSAGDEALLADRMRHVDAAAYALWQQAAGYANEAMTLEPLARNHPDYGTALFDINLVLGMAAMSKGDPQTAAEHLLAAAGVPATDYLRYPMAGLRPWGRTDWQQLNPLAAALLKVGERDAVAKFLDRYAGLSVTQREKSLEDAALIRSGKNPDWPGI
jgi:hypothetical protein